MNDETIAIVFILFVIGAFILYRKWFNRRKKIYVASDEMNGGYRLRIVEFNPRTDDAQVLLSISHPSKTLDIDHTAIEFISPKREFQTIKLEELMEEEIKINYDESHQSARLKFYKSDMLRGIRNREIKLYRFRFVWQMESGSKFKTHEMAISARYIFFKPDSGFFN